MQTLAQANNNKTGYTTILALTKLLACPDADAMLASLRIIESSVMHMPSARVTFAEADIEAALEAVCDLPLGNDSTSNQAADIAADLIDFLVGEDQFDDPVIAPATNGDTFVFGLQNASAPAPMFMPNLQTNVASGSILAPIASVGADSSAAMGLGRGRGRGRGQTMPAWATRQQQQQGHV